MSRTIGQVVARLRQRKGYTQRGLAALSRGKLGAQWLGALEKDRIKNPPPEKLELLAAYLDTTVLEIYRDAGIVEVPFPEGTSPEEQRLLIQFRQLSPQQKNALLEFVERSYSSEGQARIGKELAKERSEKSLVDKG